MEQQALSVIQKYQANCLFRGYRVILTGIFLFTVHTDATDRHLSAVIGKKLTHLIE